MGYGELWSLSWQISERGVVCNECSKIIDVCICLLMQRHTHAYIQLSSFSSVLFKFNL